MNFSCGMDANKNFGNRWQDFEDYILKVVQCFANDVDFRKVFFNDERKFEIDVVGYWDDFCLCVDCKLYGTTRYRKHSLKNEASKHVFRCIEFEKCINLKCVPVLVTLLDDGIYSEFECLIVPYYKFNSFLCDIEQLMKL
ncbi:MAG: hypothetical protein ABIG84_02500 [archaeon]